MKKLTIKTSILLVAGLLLASQGFAAVSADQADRLGKDLTPMGGEMAGNADGTIPAWDGGITTPPASYKKGMHHPTGIHLQALPCRLDVVKASERQG